MIGPPPLQDRLWYQGGLTLRNRTLMMEILDAPHNWMPRWARRRGASKVHGWWEDIFSAEKMKERGAWLPDWSLAVRFALEIDWNWEAWKTPLGLHKVQTDAKGSMPRWTRFGGIDRPRVGCVGCARDAGATSAWGGELGRYLGVGVKGLRCNTLIEMFGREPWKKCS